MLDKQTLWTDVDTAVQHGWMPLDRNIVKQGDNKDNPNRGQGGLFSTTPNAVNWEFWDGFAAAKPSGDEIKALKDRVAYFTQSKPSDLDWQKNEASLLYSFFYHLLLPKDENTEKDRKSLETLFDTMALGEILPASKVIERAKDLRVIAKQQVGLTKDSEGWHGETWITPRQLRALASKDQQINLIQLDNITTNALSPMLTEKYEHTRKMLEPLLEALSTKTSVEEAINTLSSIHSRYHAYLMSKTDKKWAQKQPQDVSKEEVLRFYSFMNALVEPPVDKALHESALHGVCSALEIYAAPPASTVETLQAILSSNRQQVKTNAQTL